MANKMNLNVVAKTDGKLVDKVHKSLEKLLKCQYENFINAIKILY